MDINTFIAQWVTPSNLHRTFYHFTDKRNLPSIHKAGGLFSHRELDRQKIAIPAVGGNQWSLEADQRCGMDAYVHLTFFDSHPMEYKARKDGHLGETTFLKIDPSVILLAGVLMTDDVSNQAGVVAAAPAGVLDKLDLEVIYKKTDWKNESIKKRRVAAFRYEILVPNHVPMSYFR